ncbi:MAG: PD-(D/E)XK nuclease family protein [Burkholderiaceae bacterium]|nr:PD-(D/E)XK nuclease family protein [Burkholderiaceae bacterium]
MSTPSAEQLNKFLERLRQLPKDKPAPAFLPDPNRLAVYLDSLRDSVPKYLALNHAESMRVAIKPPALSSLFVNLSPPLKRLRAMGTFCNPWQVALLGRDEVRNTAVLAWLLDPGGDHGLGGILLDALLARIHGGHPWIPCASTGRVNVVREACINDEACNRVDIELHNHAFYLLIEAKIGAPEGVEQLARYAETAAVASRNRPWSIVYLTTHGRPSRTAGVHVDHVLPLSWKDLSRTLLSVLDRMDHEHPAFQGFSFRLAETFLRHVRTV